MMHDNSIDFSMIIVIDVIQDVILTIFDNDVKMNKCRNNSENAFVNVINASKLTVNS